MQTPASTAPLATKATSKALSTRAASAKLNIHEAHWQARAGESGLLAGVSTRAAADRMVLRLDPLAIDSDSDAQALAADFDGGSD
jgi:hypothetical protein